jgi:hypothetical protein
MQVQGFTTGSPIHSGRLTFWPLQAPDVDLGFVGQVKVKDDRGGYGRLTLKSDNGPAVAPWGMSFFFSGGQDRAIREAVYIPSQETVVVSAVCLEPSEGGMWHGQNTKVGMLPPSLMAALPSGGGYAALWKGIRQRHKSVGQKGETVAGLLEGQSLKSVAVSGMRGMIITLDGRPIAVEIAPTAQGFSEWWNDYGLGETFSFEAKTLPSLPMPLGDVVTEPIQATENGMQKVTAWQVLKGWLYAQASQIVYASLVDGEALLLFQGEEAESSRHMVEWEVPDA